MKRRVIKNKQETAPPKKNAPQTEPNGPVKKAVKRATKNRISRQARIESDANDTNAGRAGDQQPGNGSFVVVGVGASAGGLEAFKELLAHLPIDTGMAFVLVMHLDPKHESVLPELLAKATRMPVSEVQDGMVVTPDHVYVIPRNTSMAIEGGALRLRPRQEGRGQHRPIDSFLQSLSEDRNTRAIGVILSGTATDGTLGLEAIKAEGGITSAQDPRSAKFDSMPRSDLLIALRAAVNKARKDESAVRKENLRVRHNGKTISVNLEVIPIKHPTSRERHFLALFETAETADQGRGREAGGAKRKSEEQRMVTEVIDTVSVKEVESRDNAGRWRSLRVRPYRTMDNKIDGAVVAILDIDALKQTEREIRVARDYAEAILRTARAPLIVLGADLGVDMANDAFYKTFKVSPDVTEGRLIYDLGNRQWDIPRLRQLLEDVIPRNSVFNDYEVTHEFQSIGKRTMLLNARRLDSPEGGPERILLGIDDVTERLEAVALRESEERFRTLADNAPALIWVTGPTGCEFVNREYLEFLGVAMTEVLGDKWANFIHPEDRGAYVNAFLETASSRDRFEGEFRFRRRDGEYRWMQTVGMPRFEGGEFKGYVGSTFDIHDRKLAETAMAQLAAIVESSDDAIISKDLNGIIRSWNKGAEKLFGYTAEEVTGKPVTIIIPPGRADEELYILDRIRRGEQLDPYETVRRRKDGSEIDISLTVSPIRDKVGKVVGASKIARDISDRKRSEIEREELLRRESAARAEAENASRIKDEFLATVSHELRSPLNAILGWARMLSENQIGQEKSAHAFEVIYRNARAQNQLIGDLLDVSRIITGKLRLELSEVELIPIIEAAMDVVRPAAEAKNIRLISTLDPAAGLASVDADRLQQIVWNLLSNSVKFTPAGGQVAVHLEREGTRFTITVSDTGEGIEPEFLPFVFDRFRQFEGDATRAHGGLGLGLAIVRHLVELHGGTISVTSPGKGRGATFSMTLPLRLGRMETSGDELARLADAGEITRRRVSSPDHLRDLRVLVVDDELDARELLSSMLTDYGAEVKSCASSAEALQTLDEWQPDVLVSDIGMPREDGYTFMRKVRARDPERGGRLPAVAVTAYARARDERMALAAGYQMHIPKPVESDLLAATVASLAGVFSED